MGTKNIIRRDDQRRAGRLEGAVIWKGKKVLVTGSEGMIGRELVELLQYKQALVYIADIRNGWDLTNKNNCIERCKEMDYVFHLAGIKGSPKMTNERPADFMVPMLQFDTNMIAAAQACKVKRFLYTSSIAVLNPQTDRYPSWAKKTGEMLVEAMRIQYPEGTKYCVVRPANVYGRFDNLDREGLMVVSNLIKKGLESKDGTLTIWGDGSAIRDFVNAKDVARAMMLVMEKMPEDPINIGSGKEYTIREVAAAIARHLNLEIVMDGENIGDHKRVIDSSELQKMGFKPEVNMEDGIKEAIEWLQKKN